MNTLLIATKAAAAVTLIAILSTETMGGLAGDVHDAVFPSAQAATANFTIAEARVEVGQVLYTAEGDRIGAIRAVGRDQGQYTVVYTADAMFLGEDISIVDGQVQLRSANIDMADLMDSEDTAELSASLVTALPR